MKGNKFASKIYEDNEPTSINLPKLAKSIDDATTELEKIVNEINDNNEAKKESSKFLKHLSFIGTIILAIIIAGSIIFTFITLIKHKPPKEGLSGSTTKDAKTKTISEICHIEREHIHLMDLSKEEQKNLNISIWISNISLFTNSEIKSIVFNGKEYDYQDVLTYLTDYKRMTSFVASNTTFYNAKKVKNGKYQNYIKTNYTASDVAYFEAFLSSKSDTYNSVKYYTPTTNELIDYERESATAKRYIQVSWEFPKKALTAYNKGLYYLADTSYYGKSHSSNDNITFSVDGLRNNIDYDEEFGFVLKDGRFVHMIDSYEGNLLLTKNIIVNNYAAQWED